MKYCPQCQTSKYESEFGHRSGKNKHLLRSYCNACESENALRYHRKNPDVLKRNNRIGGFRRRGINITLEQYDQMYKEQDGRCYICGCSVDEHCKIPKPLFVDHDHKTGKIRKLLCSRCNTGIGMFKEDINLLEKAISYLMEFTIQTSTSA